MTRLFHLVIAILIMMASLCIIAVSTYWLNAMDLPPWLSLPLWAFPLLTAGWLAKRYYKPFGRRPGEIE